MSANAVVSGSLAEIKFIKTRSVCVLCIELPIENAEDAISKFGIPLPGQEIPVAVARLVVSPVSAEVPEIDEPAPIVSTAKPKDPGKSDRAKESYRSLDAMGRAVTRSAIICDEPAFKSFLIDQYGFPIVHDAPAALRDVLRIKSRREIGTDERAFNAFRDVEHQFAVYQGREPEPR